MKIDKSYKLRDGCHNCKYVAEIIEFDGENSYYCTYDAPPRPNSGSIAMKEYYDEYDLPDNLTKEEEFKRYQEHCVRYDIALEVWTEWSEGREVLPWGICNFHALKTE